MPLTASSQALEPHDADVVPKSRQQARVCRYREIGEVPSSHGAEILPLLVNRHMPAPSKRLLDLAELVRIRFRFVFRPSWKPVPPFSVLQ